jgi:GxxExxY protein
MRESKSKPESAVGAAGAEVSAPRAHRLNQLTEAIIGAAIEVHRATGPGLMEWVYAQCLCFELGQRGLSFQRQVELPVEYKGIKLDCGFRMDLVVENEIALELKTVDPLLPIPSAQRLTYLKRSRKKIGPLINFNEPVLMKGLKQLANRAPDAAAAYPSAPSARSDFDFLFPRRLSVSAVNI